MGVTFLYEQRQRVAVLNKKDTSPIDPDVDAAALPYGEPCF